MISANGDTLWRAVRQAAWAALSKSPENTMITGRSATRQLVERLVFVRQLQPVSVEIAGAGDAGQLPVGMSFVPEIADAGAGRMELSDVMLECDRRAISRVGIGHPTARICLHERLDLLECVGVEEEALVRPVGEIGRPLLARTIVVTGCQRAEVCRHVLVRDTELLHLRLIEPEIDEPAAEADLGAELLVDHLEQSAQREPVPTGDLR